jgi:cathepsin D
MAGLLLSVLCVAQAVSLPTRSKGLSRSDAHLFDDAVRVDIPITRQTSDDHHGFERRSLSNMASDDWQAELERDSVVLMANHKTTQYVAPFYIGTPAERFTLILDTGSSNMWIYGSSCHTEVCTMHKRFDHKKSSTWSKNGTGIMIKYGSGKIEGILSTDNMFFEDCSQVKDCHVVTGQQFGEVEYTEGKAFQWGKYDGIVGLAFPKLAIDGTVPPFDNLFYQNRLKNPVFSFYMTPKAGQEGSVFSMGGIKKELYTGDLRWHSLFVTEKTPEYWTVKLTDVWVDGKALGLCKPYGCPFAVDTGTSLITGPSHMVNRVIDRLDVDEGCRRLKGGKLPKLAFEIDDTRYEMEGEDYVMKVQEDGADVCIGGLRDLDLPPEKGPMWIAGDVFLRKFYSVYDRNDLRVGLATAAPVESVYPSGHVQLHL